jgi:hypothetical protein
VKPLRSTAFGSAPPCRKRTFSVLRSWTAFIKGAARRALAKDSPWLYHFERAPSVGVPGRQLQVGRQVRPHRKAIRPLPFRRGQPRYAARNSCATPSSRRSSRKPTRSCELNAIAELMKAPYRGVSGTAFHTRTQGGWVCDVQSVAAQQEVQNAYGEGRFLTSGDERPAHHSNFNVIIVGLNLATASTRRCQPRRT